MPAVRQKVVFLLPNNTRITRATIKLSCCSRLMSASLLFHTSRRQLCRKPQNLSPFPFQWLVPCLRRNNESSSQPFVLVSKVFSLRHYFLSKWRRLCHCQFLPLRCLETKLSASNLFVLAPNHYILGPWLDNKIWNFELLKGYFVFRRNKLMTQ